MNAASPTPRSPLIIGPDQGRHYAVGRMSAVFKVEVAGQWTQAPRGENRGSVRAGFISINVPGGFENMMPRLLQHFAENPVGDVAP
jgi:hypothetical protein